MPKDATKNVDRYKVRGGELNEFDFHQNQEEFANQQKGQAANLIPGTPPEKKARKAAKGTKEKKSTGAKKATKATTSTKARKATRAGAKKAAPRKAAKKK